MEEKTPQNFSNKWRNALAIFLLVLVGLGLVRYEMKERGFDFQQYSLGDKLNMLNLEVLNSKKDVDEVVEGDVVFEYNPVIVPILHPSSTPLDMSNFTADCILVKDKDSGSVLLNKNEYTHHPIASITKLMTALVLLEYNIDWNATTTVIGPDSYGTHMYAGDIYNFKELWDAMLIASSNKAALSLVESINGTEEEFVIRMNERAGELGLFDTVFTDVTGIEETNISTASDVLILLSEALRYSQIRDAMLKKEHNLYSKEREKGHHMWNTNWLILNDPNPWIRHSFDKIIGGKTGFIPAAGFNFTVEVEKDGQVIDIVVLGTDNNEARFVEARDLGQWVFDNFIWQKK